MTEAILLEPFAPREVVLFIYRSCFGRANSLNIRELVEALTNRRSTESQERKLRKVIQELCLEGWPIAATPETGYYFASCPEDLEETFAFLRGRAMVSLQRIARMKARAIPYMVGQQTLPLEGVEPGLPVIKPYMPGSRIGLHAEISEALYLKLRGFLERNWHLSQDDLLERALTEYLTLRGVEVPNDLLSLLAEEEG